MIGLESQCGLQIGLPHGGRFARHAENQIQRHIQAAATRQLHGAGNIVSLMVALQQPQLVGIERLSAQAQARNAVFGQQRDGCHIDVRRIGLDAEFVPCRQWMPVQHDFQ